jgi:hypothetical protein
MTFNTDYKIKITCNADSAIQIKNSRPKTGTRVTRVTTLVDSINTVHLEKINGFPPKALTDLKIKAFHTLLEEGFTSIVHRFPPATGSLERTNFLLLVPLIALNIFIFCIT